MARFFSANTDKITLSGQPSGTTFTVSVWIYMTANAGYKGVYNDAAGSKGLYMLSGKPNWYDASHGTDHVTPSAISLNVWHHVAATYDTTTLLLYVDGAQAATFTVAGLALQSSAMIGNDNSLEYMQGRLAEVAVWTAKLTASEVAALATGVNASRVRPPPALYFPLWGLASPEMDLSGNRYTGTVAGTAKGNHAPVTIFTPKDRTSPTAGAAAAVTQKEPLQEVRQGPPLRGAPWIQTLPVAEAGLLVIQAAPPPVVIPAVPFQEVVTGPPLWGAPWLGRLPPAEAGLLIIQAPPAAVVVVPFQEITTGPPMREAPWLARLPIENPLLYGPRFQPAPPIPPGPGRGLARPFIERLPDTTDTRRLSRIMDKLSGMLNSLIGQAVLQQTGPETWAIRNASFVMTRPPTASDDSTKGAVVGGWWVDTAARKMYFCAGNAVGSAVWIASGSGSGLTGTFP